MSIFKQKRKETRKTLIYYLELSERETGSPIGRIVDITVDGIQLVGETPSEIGAVYKLNLQLPVGIHGISQIPVDIRCVRTDKDPNSRYHYSGFQFKDMDPLHASVIEQLINQYEF